MENKRSNPKTGRSYFSYKPKFYEPSTHFGTLESEGETNLYGQRRAIPSDSMEGQGNTNEIGGCPCTLGKFIEC